MYYTTKSLSDLEIFTPYSSYFYPDAPHKKNPLEPRLSSAAKGNEALKLELHHLRVAVRNGVGRHNSFAEGEAGDGNHFEVTDAQGDADDGKKQRDRRNDMANGDPQARKQKPDHVCKGNADIIAAGFCHHRAPERPEGVAGHAETSDPEGDGDNEHIHINPGDGIADG